MSYDTTRDDLQTLFSEVGSVVEVFVPTERHTGKPRGFAFVEFADDGSAATAIERFDGHELGGRNLRVSEAQERQRRAPSFGDGGGGLILPGDDRYDAGMVKGIPSPSNPGGKSGFDPRTGTGGPGQLPGGYEAPPKPGSEKDPNAAFAPFRPPSEFLDADEYREIRDSTTGRYSGVGLEVSTNEGEITVIAPIDGTPAARAGIESGAQIIEIYGVTTRDRTLDEAIDQVREALAAEPDDTRNGHVLNALYRQKVEFLWRVSRLSS